MTQSAQSGSVAERETTWGTPADREDLTHVARSVVAVSGFGVCSLTVRRSDEMLELVGVHGEGAGC